MRLEKVKQLIEAYEKPKYCVAFERFERGLIAACYFPERDEPAFATEEEAWDWAEKFGRATSGTNFNIYVTTDQYAPTQSGRPWAERRVINRR